jgi:hypothetical protein
VVEVSDRPVPTSRLREGPALAVGADADAGVPTDVSEQSERPAAAPADLEPSRRDEFPRLRVRLVEASGAPAGSAEVYALPAGAPGVDDAREVATDWSQDEDFTLVLPRPGLYDVGASRGTSHVLREDVSVPAVEPLVLRLPETAPVRFDAAPELVSRLRPEKPPEPPHEAQLDPLLVHFVPATSVRTVQYPGRGEVGAPRERFVARISREVASTTVPCPRGVRYRVARVAGRIPVTATPAEFLAPSTISLAPAGARIHFEMRFPSLSAALGHGVTPVAHLSIEGVEEEVVAQETYGSAERLSRRPLRYDGWHVPVESGFLTWRGPGLRSGRVAFQADSDGEAKIVVDALVEGTLPTSPFDSRPARSFRVVAVEPDPPPEVHLDWSDGADVKFTWDPGRGEGTGVVRGDFRHLLALGTSPDGNWTWLSQIATAGDSGPIELRLRRGGWLLLAPGRWPEELLPIRVSVAGVPYTQFDSEWGESATVVPGTVVGPLLPGPTRLLVRLGGVDIGEVETVVRPGAIVPVVIPTSPPPR